MDEVDASRGLLITALGLFMYFEFEAVERLLDACAKRFRGSAVVFDAVSRWLSEASRKDRLDKPDGYKPPPWTWGIDREKRGPLRARELRLPRGRGPFFGFLAPLASRVPPLRRAFFSILLARLQLAGRGGGLVARRRLLRREHHRHVAAVLLGALLDDREISEVLGEAVEDHLAALGVGHLAPAEHDRHLDLVAPLEEALDVALLGVVVVLGDLRPELDLADVDLLLVLAGGLLFLVLLVLVLRVVQDPGHRRLGVGRHLDEVEVAVLCHPQGVGGAHDPHLLAVLVDEPDLGDADALVDPGGVALRRLPVETSGDRH
jgi:hypothetical protein